MAAPDLPIRQAVRESLPQMVARQLMELIDSGLLKPGQQLPSELELREKFGVGRSTVREALNGLVLIKAIEVRHGQGAFVLGRQTDTTTRLDAAVRSSVTTELIEAREAMEPAIAGLAAERATETDLRELRTLLDRAANKVQAGGVAYEEAAKFHLLIAEASQNELFAQFIAMILEYLSERGGDLSVEPTYNTWEIDAHREILDAIATGDRSLAQSAMVQHMRDMRSIHQDGWAAFRAEIQRASQGAIGSASALTAPLS